MFNPGEYIRQIATHYPDSDSVRRVLGFAEADLLYIDIEGTPLNIWFEALNEVEKQGRLEKFLDIISSEYPALHIERENIISLKDFLKKESLPDKSRKNIPFSYILLAVSFVLFMFLLILFVAKRRSDNEIAIQLYFKDTIPRVITSGKLIIHSATGNQSHEININPIGLIVISQPEDWMHKEKVRIELSGTTDDTLSLFSVDSIIKLAAGDTTIIVAEVEKKNTISVYDFIRLDYGSNSFEFPADASVLMLKKYIMSMFDSKAGLPADRQMLFYADKQWANDVQLNEIPWTETRKVVLKYRLSTPADYSSMTIHMEGIDLTDGIAFLNEEPGEIISREGTNTILKFPKLVGSSQLRIFFNDSLLLMPVTTGYSDYGKLYNRMDYGQYLMAVQKRAR